MNGWVFSAIWAAVILPMAMAFVLGDTECEKQRKEFMIECQTDGLKHYQCVSLWNGGGLAVFHGRDMLPLDMN
jgi:hypothetical protein